LVSILLLFFGEFLQVYAVDYDGVYLLLNLFKSSFM